MRQANNFSFCDECEHHIDCVAQGQCDKHPIRKEEDKEDNESVLKFRRDNPDDDDD